MYDTNACNFSPGENPRCMDTKFQYHDMTVEYIFNLLLVAFNHILIILDIISVSRRHLQCFSSGSRLKENRFWTL